ncbi:MAG: universal stress protein [Saprospiraceae bacterium]|nr:universal stress protein [Lewinella sp.]
MERIQKILVPTDFSDAALHAYQYALRMADRLGGTLHLLHVIYPQVDSFDAPVIATQATRAQIDAATEVMDTFKEAGIDMVKRELTNIPTVQQSIEVGSAVAVITSIAHKEQYPLIIMGTRGEHSAMEKILGTVSSGVVGNADCPVVVVPEFASPKEILRVAYATDLQVADPYEIWRVAKLLAPFHTIMHVVHFGNGNKKSTTPLLEELEEFFRGNVPALQIQFHQFEQEELTDDINAFAEQYNIDLLVMYRSHRNFPESLFHRSQTKKMSKRTRVPLLVM